MSNDQTEPSTEHISRWPISEVFRSPKGEGVYLGQPMTFLRFAGCSVGKVAFKKFNCTTIDGRQFDCDTDFNRHKWMTLQDMLKECDGFEYVCITGGEPLDQRNLDSVIRALQSVGHKVHIETSGTVHLGAVRPDWIACSPKLGMLPEFWQQADEIKFLVDEHFNESEVVATLGKFHPPGIIFVMPISGIREINSDNTQRALALIQRHPNWRICIQAHKVWGVR